MMTVRTQTSAAAGAAAFTVGAHPHHPRLRHVTLSRGAVRTFFRACEDIDVQRLEYVPFMRFALAGMLEAAVGPGLGSTLRGLVHDRETGGFTLGVEGVSADEADYVKFGTAVGHLLGPANHDSMSGTYYARFLVKHTDNSDSYLRQAYRALTLHTDGTFVEEATDWLLMMKFSEFNAAGGESRLMHIDDWEARDAFRRAPLADHPFLYKAPGSKNVETAVQRPVFFDSPFGLSMSFIDQFAQPQTLAEAAYLRDLSESMEASAATREVPLPVGDLVVLNNYFWFHGRAPFQPNPQLSRELMRQRGVFAE